MSDAHTPGPWFATKDSQWNAICHVGRAYNISTKMALSDLGDIEADARLIAAAPLLLEALEQVTDALAQRLGTNATEWADVSRARAAIAAARGAT